MIRWQTTDDFSFGKTEVSAPKSLLIVYSVQEDIVYPQLRQVC